MQEALLRFSVHMDAVRVKEELVDTLAAPGTNKNGSVPVNPVSVIDLSTSSSSDSDSGDDSEEEANGNDNFGASAKRRRLDDFGAVLPVGFLAPLPPDERTPAALPAPKADTVQRNSTGDASTSLISSSSKQFWKAGDYEGAPCGDWHLSSGGIDHVRVHPKFLHSNATSHKWALGAFAELLDNSLDEVCNGGTYVNIDMIENRKDGSRMLLIEDDGGGMDPDKMRQCMSLGYSAKSKIANTIGQYGNGFKTSTMRLGADVIVFSRCIGKDGKSPTQSIGLLSYTFLRSTRKEDIIVPMIDYQGGGGEWNKIIRSSLGDCNKNVETIVQWSPFSSEADLLHQFNLMGSHGSRIIIFNLWEDDQGQLELDFDADPHDIQLRGVNRDEKNIQMAREFPNSRHFLTYRHSLRSYASILYLRLPPGFRIILRGKDVEHHNIVNDMMMSQEITYRPQPGAHGVPKDFNMAAVVTIGFVKDARFHIDVQGFNVYHKNRLIKPFWRLWNAAGSDGRGVIGVLEANFVEPAHDKQGFERTTVLARLETRLIQMQKQYWSTYCHKIGYAPRRNKKLIDESENRETSPDFDPRTSSQSKKKSASSSRTPLSYSDKFYSRINLTQRGKGSEIFRKEVDGAYRSGHASRKGSNSTKIPAKSEKKASLEQSSPFVEDVSDDDVDTPQPSRRGNDSTQKTSNAKSFEKNGLHTTRSPPHLEDTESQQYCASEAVKNGNSQSDLCALEQLKHENHDLKLRLENKEAEILRERERCKLLESEVQAAKKKIEDLNQEQESLIDIFSEERDRRDKEEENLRKRLKDASNTIQDLLGKINQAA